MKNPFQGMNVKIIDLAKTLKRSIAPGRIKLFLSKPRSWIILGFIALLIFTAVLLFYPYRINGSIIEIPHGTHFNRISRMLYDNGIIKNEPVFKAAGYFTKLFSHIKYGEYEFMGRVSVAEVLWKLTRWDVKMYKITIPEGSTVEEAALIFAGAKLIDRGKFINLTKRSSFEIDSYGFPPDLEGYLYPDTYYFAKVPHMEEFIICKMLTQFKKKVVDVYGEKITSKGMSLRNVLIIASIVEKEAMVDTERPTIAKVFYNRLKKGMALQSCSTVRYALNKYSGKLSNKDINTCKSKFNTYRYSGMPPGPICNPGSASIKAAINPAEVKYLYFVSKNNGTHFFTSKFEEHSKAKRKYQGS